MQITNECYRLHPVEWSIGEAVGLLEGFQEFVRGEGIETEWKG